MRKQPGPSLNWVGFHLKDRVGLTRPVSYFLSFFSRLPPLSSSLFFFLSLISLSLTETPWPRTRARALFATTHHRCLHQQWRRILALSPSTVSLSHGLTLKLHGRSSQACHLSRPPHHHSWWFPLFSSRPKPRKITCLSL
jgi:hypothetical protein